MYLGALSAVSTRMSFTKSITVFSVMVAVICGDALTNKACADPIKKFPILERLQNQQQPVAHETTKWMSRWRGIDLENPVYDLYQISGSSSVYVKIKKPDSTQKDGYMAYGTFASRNGANNPGSEVAYFNLAAILGYDYIFRPVIPYSLGTRASQAFKVLLQDTVISGATRIENEKRVLQDIASGKPLKGCLKAKKMNTNIAYDAIADIKLDSPKKSNPIIMALQATSPQPSSSQKMELLKGYSNNMLQLAREYSIIMTLDVIFQQWDRYSGANVVLAKDKAGVAHFYSSDNGGADLKKDTGTLLRNLKWFSRYDHKTINQLKTLYNFLVTPEKGFLGYKNAELFVADLGLYGELKPAEYVALLKQNLKIFLSYVAKVEHKFGNKAYLP